MRNLFSTKVKIILVIAALLTAEKSTFDSFCDVMLTLTRETMEEGVRDGQLSSRLQTLHLQILGRGVSGELLQVLCDGGSMRQGKRVHRRGRHAGGAPEGRRRGGARDV